MPDRIVSIVRESGPLTGADLLERTGDEVFGLWRECRAAPSLHLEVFGRRFLRLDRAVEGYARLSPSIRREFLTYTVIGLAGQEEEIAKLATRLRQDIEDISRAKWGLAQTTMEAVVTQSPGAEAVFDHACFIIAGDVTYNMAHTVPRPERSTGRMVQGSDLDIIVVADDELPPDALEALDAAIFRQKHFMLVHPDYREEIDYVIKRLAKVRGQLRFDTFEAMVACKIMQEGQLLIGSERVFGLVKDLLRDSGAGQRLQRMEEAAAAHRAEAEAALLKAPDLSRDRAFRHLFYTREEIEEIY